MISIDRLPNVESLGNAVPFVGRIREIIEVIKLFEDFEPGTRRPGALHALLPGAAGYRGHPRRR
jgi:hypothetical protein